MNTQHCCPICKQVKDPSEFYASTSYCKPCQAERAREYRRKNVDRAREVSRDWKSKNPDRVRDTQQTWREATRERRREVAAAYREANREKVNGWARNQRYGLKAGEYEAILASQDSCCAICRLPFAPGAEQHLDHNHETGARRGILCRGCNHGLGNFRESPETLTAAIDYLQKYHREP